MVPPPELKSEKLTLNGAHPSKVSAEKLQISLACTGMESKKIRQIAKIN